MDRFLLDYERSLALHEAVAAELLENEKLLDRARRKLDDWIAQGGRSLPLWLRWRAILRGPVEQVVALLTERSEEAALLRKASPFAGVLPPPTRLRILREVRRRLESAA